MKKISKINMVFILHMLLVLNIFSTSNVYADSNVKYYQVSNETFYDTYGWITVSNISSPSGWVIYKMGKDERPYVDRKDNHSDIYLELQRKARYKGYFQLQVLVDTYSESGKLVYNKSYSVPDNRRIDLPVLTFPAETTSLEIRARYVNTGVDSGSIHYRKDVGWDISDNYDRYGCFSVFTADEVTATLLTGSNDAYEAKIAAQNAEESAQDAKNSANSTLSKVNTVDTKANQIKTDTSDIKDKLDDVKGDISSLESKLGKTDSSVTNINKEVSNIKSQINNLETNITNIIDTSDKMAPVIDASIANDATVTYGINVNVSLDYSDNKGLSGLKWSYKINNSWSAWKVLSGSGSDTVNISLNKGHNKISLRVMDAASNVSEVKTVTIWKL